MKPLVLGLLLTVFVLAGCAQPLAERLKTAPVSGQPGSRVVLDRQDCTAVAKLETERAPVRRTFGAWITGRTDKDRWDAARAEFRRYTACMVARGYIAETEVWFPNVWGGIRPDSDVPPLVTHIRSERTRTEEEVATDLSACEQKAVQAFRDTPSWSSWWRELVGHLSFRSANTHEDALGAVYRTCLASRGYAAAPSREDPILLPPQTR